MMINNPTSGEILINGISLEPKNRIELLSLMNFASPYIELPKNSPLDKILKLLDYMELKILKKE